MPTYEYACNRCQHCFEKFQSMTEKPIRKCPKCGRLSVRRLISSGAGFIFKGSGFYQTDYRSKNYQEAAKKEKPSETSGSDGKEKKSEAPSSKKAKTDKSKK